MPRKEKFVNIAVLQNIINKEQASGSWTNHLAFFTECATQYNLVCPLEPITYSIVRLRYNAGLITTSVQAGRKGIAKGTKLTESHKKVLHEGRKSSRRKGLSPLDAKSIALLRIQWKDDPSAIAMIDKLALPHKMKDKIRWNCYQCMGGSRLGVKSCTSGGCVFYNIRPWQKDTSGD